MNHSPRVWLSTYAAQLHMQLATDHAITTAGTAIPTNNNGPAIGTPADMRGIPAIGPNCPGHIPGTRPGP